MTKAITVVGNWKMYKTARQATDYLEALMPLIEGSSAHVYLAVPFTAIQQTAHYAKNSPILIGAQNMNDASEGAYTGEVAALMLKEAGAAFVLLGHSERRIIFGEADAFIHKKVIRALKDDILPILCVGETLEARDEGRAEEVLKGQLEQCLEGIPKEEASKLMIAYEPVWAIGTGKTASVKNIEEAHAFIRQCLIEIFGKKVGAGIPILYGGSVKPENVSEIGAIDDVDGVLVGGASLEPDVLAKIIHNITGATRKKKE